MRTVSLLVLLLTTLGLSAFGSSAAPANNPSPCANDTVDAYERLGGTGCTLTVNGAEFTFKNFSFSLLEGSLLNSDVHVTPLTPDGKLNLGLASEFFSVGAGSRLVFKFGYVLDPPPPILEDMSMDLDANSPVAPGFATIDVDLCAGGLFFGETCDYERRQFTLLHFGDNNPNNVLSGLARFSPTNIIDVRTVITLDGGPENGGGSSQINGFSYASSPVPEPASVFAVITGLGLCAIRRRRQGTSRKPSTV